MAEIVTGTEWLRRQEQNMKQELEKRKEDFEYTIKDAGAWLENMVNSIKQTYTEKQLRTRKIAKVVTTGYNLRRAQRELDVGGTTKELEEVSRIENGRKKRRTNGSSESMDTLGSRNSILDGNMGGLSGGVEERGGRKVGVVRSRYSIPGKENIVEVTVARLPAATRASYIEVKPQIYQVKTEEKEREKGRGGKGMSRSNSNTSSGSGSGNGSDSSSKRRKSKSSPKRRDRKSSRKPSVKANGGLGENMGTATLRDLLVGEMGSLRAKGQSEMQNSGSGGEGWSSAGEGNDEDKEYSWEERLRRIRMDKKKGGKAVELNKMFTVMEETLRKRDQIRAEESEAERARETDMEEPVEYEMIEDSESSDDSDNEQIVVKKKHKQPKTPKHVKASVDGKTVTPFFLNKQKTEDHIEETAGDWLTTEQAAAVTTDRLLSPQLLHEQATAVTTDQLLSPQLLHEHSDPDDSNRHEDLSRIAMKSSPLNSHAEPMLGVDNMEVEPSISSRYSSRDTQFELKPNEIIGLDDLNMDLDLDIVLNQPATTPFSLAKQPASTASLDFITPLAPAKIPGDHTTIVPPGKVSPPEIVSEDEDEEEDDDGYTLDDLRPFMDPIPHDASPEQIRKLRKKAIKRLKNPGLIPTPKWAKTPNLIKQLVEQHGVNPDAVFGRIRPLKVNEIFSSDMAAAELKNRKKSSGVFWTGTDALTTQEIEAYNRQMGYTN